VRGRCLFAVSFFSAVVALRLLLASGLLVLLAGCASLPAPTPQPPSHALADVSDTALGRIAAASLPADDTTLSGFRLLPEGPTAFQARLALARQAQKSLDVQYYLIGNDKVGLQFLRELRDAAARGVRVRLLVDDLYTAGEDPLLTGLAAFPNIEVRLFNPLPSRSESFNWRVLSSLHDFGRINHRMHNKLFIADNRMAISGGRNMADEYFTQSRHDNFIDMDVLSVGPVVPQMSAVFDRYWNSRYVWPVAAVAQSLPPAQARAAFDERVAAHAGAAIEERAHDVLGHAPLVQQLQAGRLALVLAPAQVFADSPHKVDDAEAAAEGPTVSQRTLALFATARESVHITSPYFIPGEHGMAMIRAAGATDANGRIVLVTNSLASTDEPLVYAEYAKHRIDLLKAGVRVYEVGATLGRSAGLGGFLGHSVDRLHAKLASIDGRTVFIGSMNLDPRSAIINTEMGLVITSAQIAKTLSQLFQNSLSHNVYKLQLSADGERIEWVETTLDGGQRIHHLEPGDNWRTRLQIWLLAPVVAADLL
jgi:putative cardiolipin synthase